MSATSITNSIQALQSNIFMHVRHRALLQNVGEPTLKQEQLFFIQLPFLNGEQVNEDLIMSATTVGIVHASLIEHEKIKENNATSKSQQLTVLSGDYYSGRYYQLLAQTENILLIQKLSKGIVTRCEHQIKVYEQNEQTIQEWIESLSVIECELIAQYYDVYQFTSYKNIMTKTLTYLRLKEEQTFLLEGQEGYLSKALHNDKKAIISIDHALQEELMKRKYELLEIVEQAELKPELKDFIRQYITS
jgi:heptaprenyl diphosphate synthase